MIMGKHQRFTIASDFLSFPSQIVSHSGVSVSGSIPLAMIVIGPTDYWGYT